MGKGEGALDVSPLEEDGSGNLQGWAERGERE
jgi:hypothetical protein